MAQEEEEASCRCCRIERQTVSVIIVMVVTSEAIVEGRKAVAVAEVTTTRHAWRDTRLT